MTKTFKPLLAGKADIGKLQFPVLGSPKLDGIRCIAHPVLGPVSRTLKPIPNNGLRKALGRLCQPWMDGELICGSPTAQNAMQRTTSAVMGEEADWSEVKFCVFDQVSDRPFAERSTTLRNIEPMFSPEQRALIQVVPQHMLSNLGELNHYEAFCVDAGYEGIMLRKLDGAYKFGRSTTNEGILLKVKRFEDMEGIVTGFIELMHNENEAKADNLGHTKRSSSIAGKVPGNTLGALVLKISGFNETNVEVGGGFTAEQRAEIWRNRAKYLGARATFKYQPHGVKDRPRCPVFKGWRQD